MCHNSKVNRRVGRSVQERGSVYILVLGASVIVAAIGVSSLMLARVQRRSVTNTADRVQARELARSGIDYMLWRIETETSSTWRTSLNNGNYQNITMGTGTFSVTGVDPDDGNLTDDTTDPVVLTSVGIWGNARYAFEVTIDSEGTIQSGTWKRVVY